MLLTTASVKVFKSIEGSGNISIDPDVTVLVGQNEAGKTAFLKALHKASCGKSKMDFRTSARRVSSQDRIPRFPRSVRSGDPAS